MKKILVTGGTGFIGSHLIDELVRKGKEVKCLVLNHDPILKEENKKRARNLEKKGVEIFYGDLTKKETLKGLLKDVEEIYHSAAIGRPMPLPIEKFFKVNVEGTKNLFNEILKYKKQIKKIIYISSISVLGFSRNRKPLTENSPYMPVSVYGESKKDAEIFVLNFCKKNKLPCVIVRPPMVYGPRDYQFLVLFKSINTGFFPLLKKGKAKIEFLYVKNLVNALLLAKKGIKMNKIEIYNITDGKTYTTGQVFKEIAKQLNKKLLPIPKPLFKIIALITSSIYKLIGKQPIFHTGTAEWMSNDNPVSCEKAKTELNYRNKIILNKAISETIQWYKRNNYI